MNQIGKRIYYDNVTGQVLFSSGERYGDTVIVTPEQEINTFKILSERNRNSFDYIELAFNQFSQDFNVCNSYKINIKTKQIEFNYKYPESTEDNPIYEPPISLEIHKLKAQNKSLSTRSEFIEDLIAELAIKIYN